MKGIQAGADLHFFHLVHGLPVGVENARFIQRELSVGEGVFNDEVLAFFRVDEGRNIGFLSGDAGCQITDSILFQHGLNGVVRSGGDLIDHGPGEGGFGSVIDVGNKAVFDQAVILPGGCKSAHCSVQFVAVVGAVVHADQADGKRSCQKTLIDEGGNLSQIALRGLRSMGKIPGDVRKGLAFSVRQAVTLFRDGEARHLQGRRAEDFLQTSVFLRIGAVQDEGFHNTSHHRFFHGAVRLQRCQDAQVVVRTVHLFDDFIVVALRRDQARIQHAAV